MNRIPSHCGVVSTLCAFADALRARKATPPSSMLLFLAEAII